MDDKHLKLIKSAIEIRKMAYTPYSHYKVGAALLCKNGKVYTGCNIENGAFSPTVCAERVAFFDAIKNGERDFECIAIVAAKDDAIEFDYASPCGVCRQVMSEFCNNEFKIILPKVNKNGEPYDIKEYTLNEILPFRFKDF